MRVLCRHLIDEMDLLKTPCQLIDGTPVQVRHWRRFGKGHLRRVCVLGDKGFLDQERQALLHQRQGVSLLTPKRRNQKQQTPQVWNAAMNRARRMIETTFSQAKGAFGFGEAGSA